MRIGLGLALTQSSLPPIGGGEAGLPEWVPENAFIFLDGDNDRAWAGGAEHTIDEVIVPHADWNVADPAYELVVDGFTVISGVIHADYMAELIASGFTMIVNATISGGSDANIQCDFLDLPDYDGDISVSIKPASIEIQSNTDGETEYNNSGVKRVGELKAAFVVVPGTKAQIFVDGAEAHDEALSVEPETPTHLAFSINGNNVSVQDITIYVGSPFTNEQIETMTFIDEFEAPTAVSFDGGASLEENNSVGDTAGTLTSVSVNRVYFPTYSLVAGTGDTDNDDWTIDGTAVKADVVFDFETTDESLIRVGVEDQHNLSFADALVITIADEEEALVPTLFIDPENEVYEADGDAVAVNTLFSFDGDWGQNPPYVVGAAGFTTWYGFLASTYYDILKDGFSVVLELQRNVADFDFSWFNLGIMALPSNTPLLQTAMYRHENVFFEEGYAGSATGSASNSPFLSADTRYKVGFVIVPGQRIAAFVSGTKIDDNVVGAITGTNEAITFFMRNGTTIHNVSFYEGDIGDTAMEAATSDVVEDELVEYVGHQEDASNLTTYSFNVVCEAGKKMFILVGGSNATTWRFPVTVGTLNGVDMNGLGEALGGSTVTVEGYYLDSPGNGTFPFEMVWDGAQDQCGIAVFTGDGGITGNVDSKPFFPNDTPVIDTATSAAGGKAFAYVYAKGSGGNATSSWTNMVENFDVPVEGTDPYHSSAIADTPGATFDAQCTVANVTADSAGLLVTIAP